MKTKLQEISEKYAGNSFLIADVHRLLAYKDFENAQDFLIRELRFKKNDAIIFVNYYREKYSKKVELIEIKPEQVELSDLDFEPTYYLFLFGSEMIYSLVRSDYNKTLSFFGNGRIIDVSNASQIWKLVYKD